MDFQETLDMRVSWQDDIWSIGCVYSEAAVWCVCGEEGREEYRRLRQSQVPESACKAGYEAAFHDGENRLDAVHEMHRLIHYRRIVVDTITFKVGELVLQSMMRVEDGGPLDASQLRTRCNTLLSDANYALKKAWPTWPKLPSPFSPSHHGATAVGLIQRLTRSFTGSQSVKSDREYAMNVPDPSATAKKAEIADAGDVQRSIGSKSVPVLGERSSGSLGGSGGPCLCGSAAGTALTPSCALGGSSACPESHPEPTPPLPEEPVRQRSGSGRIDVSPFSTPHDTPPSSRSTHPRSIPPGLKRKRHLSGYPNVGINEVLQCRLRKDGVKQLDGWNHVKAYVKGREQVRPPETV